MPQHMRRDVRFDSRLPRVFDDLHPERLPRHRAAAIGEKEMRIGTSVKVGASAFYVRCDRIAGAVAERHDALLRSFSERTQESGIELNVFDLDANELRNAQPGRIEQLQH